MSNLTLRCTTPAGVFLGDLTQPSQATVGTQLSDIGALEWHTIASAPYVAAVLAQDEVRMTLVEDGVDHEDVWILEDDADDRAAAEGPDREVTIQARDAGSLFERGIVAPVQTADGISQYRFVQASPGTVVKTLLQEAQARGACTEISVSFLTTADSAGNPWTIALDIGFDPGQTLAQVLGTLTENSWVDWKMTGTRLDLYQAGTGPGGGGLSRDRGSAVILRGRRHDTEVTRQRTRKELNTDVLVTGDFGSNVWRADTAARTRYGRREAYIAQGGASEVGTLSTIGDGYLREHSRPREGLTVTYTPDGERNVDGSITNPPPRPWRDYVVGDWIRDDQRYLPDGSTLEPLRVRTLALTVDQNGLRSYVVEMNDVLLEEDIRLAKAIENLTNGTATVVTTLPSEALDVLAPAGPASVTMTSTAYLDSQNRTRAAVTTTWTAVTTNTDGTACDDLDRYEVSYHPTPRDPWGPWQTIDMDTEQAFLSNEPPATQIQARVRAVDHNGNKGPPTNSPPITTASDATPPVQPSAPVLLPIIGGLRIVWDGRDNAGNAMPPDFALIEVHASTVSGFVPSTATLVDTLGAAGVFPYVGLPYGSTWYVRFVAVDAMGNRSAQSVQVSGVPLQVAGGDVAPATLPDSVIGSLSASKLIASSIINDLTIAARLKTANTGARVELSSLGLDAYNTANTRTFRLAAADGSVTMTGGIISGGRVEGAQFLTEKLSDLQAAGYDQDYASLDSEGGLSIYKEGVTNYIVNPTGNPGSDVSSLTWTIGGTTFPDYWTTKEVGAGSSFYARKPFPSEVLNDTGYDIPWEVECHRAANSARNIIWNYPVVQGATGAGGLQYTVSGFINFRTVTQGMQVGAVVMFYNNMTDANADTNRVTTIGLPPLIATPAMLNHYTWWEQTFVSPANMATGSVLRIAWQDTGSTNTLNCWWRVVAPQLETNDHATTFADASSQPGSYPGGTATDPIFCYSVRDRGSRVANLGGTGALGRLSGSLVGASYRTADTGRRITIETTKDTSTEIGRIQFLEDEYPTKPNVIAVDKSYYDYVNAVYMSSIFAITTPGSVGSRYGRLVLNGDHCYIDIQKQNNNYDPGGFMVTAGAAAGGSDGGGGYLYGSGGWDTEGTFRSRGAVLSSSRTIKDSIEPIAAGRALERVRGVQPVMYRYRLPEDRPQNPLLVGVIAEDLAEVMPDCVLPGTEHLPGPHIDVMGVLTNTMHALAELADRVDALTKGDRE